MLDSSDYQQFARQCFEWALEAEDEQAREDFLSLSRDWTLAALSSRSGHEAANEYANHLALAVPRRNVPYQRSTR